MVRNGRHGAEVIEIFYNGIEPPKCEKKICKPMDDEELNEYLKKSVLSGSSQTKRVPYVSTYVIPSSNRRYQEPAEALSTTKGTTRKKEEEPTTTENLFISQEEEEEDEEEDDNTY